MKSCSTRRKSRLGTLSGIALLVLVLPVLASAQQLSVKIGKVDVSGDSIRGLTSQFSFPVITRYISVVDTLTGLPVMGLADSTRWLGPDEVANNNRTIRENWPVLLERAAGVTAAADLYNQPENPLLREVTSFSLPIIPTSTMLLMDVSTSIDTTTELRFARKGALRFVAGMRTQGELPPASRDRAGVIVFRQKKSIVLSRFTDDVAALSRAVAAARPNGLRGTPLYLALLQAINLTANEDPQRIRSLIVYTDGLNTRGGATLSQVIAAAIQRNIPVHAIYLRRSGNVNADAKAAADSLKMIADSTNGRFFTTTDGLEFEKIYGHLSQITQNFYLMAHYGPELCELPLDRMVEVTAEDLFGKQGAGVGRYTAAGPVRDYDLTLSGGVAPTEISAGDTVRFSFDIRNSGPDTAKAVRLLQMLPADTLRFLPGSASTAPEVSGGGRQLLWRNLSIPPGGSINLTFAATLDLVLKDSLELMAATTVLAACDRNPGDNAIALRFRIVQPRPLYDLELSKSAQSDTVRQSESVRYELVLTNHGPAAALDISVADTLLNIDALQGAPVFEQPPDSISGGVFVWNFDTLAVGSVVRLAYSVGIPVCAVSPNPPASIINRAAVHAARDSVPGNNMAAAVVQIQKSGCPQVDVALRKSASVDSVAAGQGFSFLLEVVNMDTTVARDVTVQDILPSGVVLESVSPPADTPLDADTLSWHFDEIAAGATRGITLQARFSCPADSLAAPLTVENVAWLAAPEDADNSNNRDSVEVVIDDFSSCTAVDFAMRKTAGTDTVRQGESFVWTLDVSRLADAAQAPVSVADALPPFVTLLSANPAPLNGLAADTLRWQFDGSVQDSSVSLRAVISCDENFSALPPTLTNFAWISALSDANAANDRDSSEVVVASGACQSVDFELQKSVTPAAIRPNEAFTWRVDVRRAGRAGSTQPLTVRDFLPPFVEVLDASPRPVTSLSADTLAWQFDTALQDTTIEISARVLCDANVQLPSQLLNLAWLETPKDVNVANDRDSVFVSISEPCPAEPFDLSIRKSVSQDTVLVGQQFRYRLIVRNDGPGASASGIVSDSPPADLRLSDFEPVPSVSDNGNLTWPLGSLAPGDSLVFGYRALFAGSDSGAEFLLRTNSARVDAADDRNAGNDESSAAVVIQALQNCEKLIFLDRNVFKPGEESPLQITVSIDLLNDARIDVYDITGYHIRNIVRGQAPIGQRTFLWDGAADNGQRAGSGVYIILFQDNPTSGRVLECDKKVIVVR